MIFSKSLLMEEAETYYTLTINSTNPVINQKTVTCELYYDGENHTITTATVKAGTIITYTLTDTTHTNNNSYVTKTDTVTMDADKTLNCSVTYSTTITGTSWTRPNLSANGSLGGGSFAVYASSENSSSYQIWKAFDASNSTQWIGNYSALPISVKIYNPNALKVSSFNMRNRSNANGYFTSGKVYVSSTNDNWRYFTSFSNSVSGIGKEWTINVNSSSFYKYYKIQFSDWHRGQAGENCGLSNIGITAQQAVTSYTYYWNIT